MMEHGFALALGRKPHISTSHLKHVIGFGRFRFRLKFVVTFSYVRVILLLCVRVWIRKFVQMQILTWILQRERDSGGGTGLFLAFSVCKFMLNVDETYAFRSSCPQVLNLESALENFIEIAYCPCTFNLCTESKYSNDVWLTELYLNNKQHGFSVLQPLKGGISHTLQFSFQISDESQ